MERKIKKLIICFFSFLYSSSLICAEIEKDNTEMRVLPIEEFIKAAIENDVGFEEILIDELSLKYKKDLSLPARDLVLSIKNQYEFDFGSGFNDPSATVSLNKLFPYKGTYISAEYENSADGNSSELSILISQSIARNAFGKATVLQDQIIGREIEVVKYQIVEAYEDHLALVIAAYYDWYSSYKNLEIGESSYQQNLELLRNIKERQRNNIALAIDVNKINIQVLAKKEGLVSLQERYENILNIIKQAMRYNGNEILKPTDPFMYDNRDIIFERDYDNFTRTSRTYRTLRLLEEKSSLEVEKNADDLLPSTNLLLGYKREEEGIGIKNQEDSVFAGISITWPFPNQKERAEYEISKIENKKTKLSNENKYVQLHTDLINLFSRIEREKKLISIAEEKIVLAESILKDETKNYSYGKVSLNDFIEAVNRVDENKFDKILHSTQLKILMTEWLRITDQLILKKNLKSSKGI